MALKFPEYGVNTFPQMVLFLPTGSFRYDGNGVYVYLQISNDIINSGSRADILLSCTNFFFYFRILNSGT